MMRLNLFFISFAICFSACSSKKDIAAVKSVMDKQVAEWNNGSVDGFMQGYWNSDSLQFISKRGVTKGWNKVCSNYKKSYNTKEKMGRLDFSNLAYTPLDKKHKLMLVTGNWQVAQKDTQGGVFSLVFKKIKGKWLIVTDHTW